MVSQMVETEPTHDLMTVGLDYAEDAESAAAAAQHALRQGLERANPRHELDQAEKRLHAVMDDAERALQKVKQVREMLDVHVGDGDEPVVPETDYMGDEDG